VAALAIIFIGLDKGILGAHDKHNDDATQYEENNEAKRDKEFFQNCQFLL
jgi:hypothetical protein